MTYLFNTDFPYLDDFPIDKDEWETLYRMIINKLGQKHGLKIFYKNDNDPSRWKILQDVSAESSVITLIPVCGFESGVTAIVCGISC